LRRARGDVAGSSVSSAMPRPPVSGGEYGERGDDVWLVLTLVPGDASPAPAGLGGH
jgi:hypothetical protein